MSAHLDRASLIAMAAGLIFVGQPWFHALFVLGFPLLLVGVAAQGAAAVLRACVPRTSVPRTSVPRTSVPRTRSGEGRA